MKEKMRFRQELSISELESLESELRSVQSKLAAEENADVRSALVLKISELNSAIESKRVYISSRKALYKL